MKTLKILFVLFLGLIIVTSAFLFGVYYYFVHDLPDLTSITGYHPKLVTEVYSYDGSLIGEFYTERRKMIPYEKIPKRVVQAFVAMEDKRFFEHPGVDLKGIIRALIRNIKKGELVEGGSTITQQVSRTANLMSRDRQQVVTPIR